MRTIFVAVSLLFSVGLTWAGSPGEPMERPHFHIGVSSRLFERVKRNDAAAAFKAWGFSVGRERGLQEQVDAFMFDSPEAMGAALARGKLDAVCIPVDEVMALGLKTDYVIIPARADGLTITYALLVHRESGIENSADLEGRRITVYEGSGMALAQGWLGSVFQDELPKVKRSANMALTEKPMKGVLEVFFRQADAALITTAAFDVACQMNPQLRNDLKLLKVSPPLIPTVFIFSHRFQGRSRQAVEDAIVELHMTPGGQQVLNMFQSSRMERHPISVLDETLRFLDGQKSAQQIFPKVSE